MVICCVVSRPCVLTYDPVRSARRPPSALLLAITEQALILEYSDTLLGGGIFRIEAGFPGQREIDRGVLPFEGVEIDGFPFFAGEIGKPAHIIGDAEMDAGQAVFG